MLGLYSKLMGRSERLLKLILKRRLRAGKEHPERLHERMGQASIARPDGKLVWLHAASVGEAQSALILTNTILARFEDVFVLLTTGTVTSARLMEKRLPDRALHQFYPLDHPDWTRRFLDHWKPDAALWLESELWPNMLDQIRERNIPAALINARMSPRSYKRWKKTRKSISSLLSAFSLVMAQTETDARSYAALGEKAVHVTDNLKYSSAALPADAEALEELEKNIKARPRWLFASTHAGEEEMACRIHNTLAEDIPDLLTIIVPRHPERGSAILDIALDAITNARRRSETHSLPQADDDIYIADTLGELGLFYRLCPIACIGRSFSKDGGGGHNPIEAAQLGCAVLYGPKVQNFEDMYAEMSEAGAAMRAENEKELTRHLRELLTDPRALKTLQQNGEAFAGQKAKVINTVMDSLSPLIESALENPRHDA